MGAMTARCLLLIGAVAGAGMSQARECRGINFPEQTQAEGSTLTLNGLGVRKATMLKVNIYVAALYVSRTSTDPAILLSVSAPTQLVLHFIRDVGANDIRKAWNEGFAENAKDRLSALQDRMAILDDWMTGMNVGQRLTFSFKPGAGVTVVVNGAAKGTIKGDDFARALFSIWLGDHPPNQELKFGLLGGACS
jgi:hypothetical protein